MWGPSEHKPQRPQAQGTSMSHLEVQGSCGSFPIPAGRGWPPQHRRSRGGAGHCSTHTHTHTLITHHTTRITPHITPPTHYIPHTSHTPHITPYTSCPTHITPHTSCPTHHISHLTPYTPPHTNHTSIYPTHTTHTLQTPHTLLPGMDWGCRTPEEVRKKVGGGAEPHLKFKPLGTSPPWAGSSPPPPA